MKYQGTIDTQMTAWSLKHKNVVKLELEMKIFPEQFKISKNFFKWKEVRRELIEPWNGTVIYSLKYMKWNTYQAKVKIHLLN